MRGFTFLRTARWGALLWMALMGAWQPHWQHDLWARSLLLLAVWVWMPLAFDLLGYPARYAPYSALAAVSITAAFLLPSGRVAALLTLPWCAVLLWVFLHGAAGIRMAKGPAGWAKSAAQVLVITGGIWALADRAGVPLMGFDPAIVLLTAVHFHYAGFIFPLLAGWLYEIWPNRALKWAIIGIIVSVPLTAAGIAVSQWYGYFVLEAISGGLVAASGMVVAAGYLRCSSRGSGWFAVAGGALLFSMVLAWGYALRPYYPMDVLTIPSMRAWHGTANALLVAGGGLLGHIRRAYSPAIRYQ